MKWTSKLFVFALICCCAALASAQQKPAVESDVDVIRVSTNLVTVPVSVMDRNGRFVPDLTQKQFHVYEDGVEQEIAFFETAEKPFTVALLLDTSDSTRFKLSDIQNAALAFIAQLAPDDRVLVATFDRQIHFLCGATSDRRVLRNAILAAHTGGGTALYNALDVIVKERLAQVRGRKAIVLFTDGVDTSSSGATYEGTLHFAEELDALIYPIQFSTYDDVTKDATAQGLQVATASGERLDAAYARANRYLRLLADKSGGRFYYADNTERLRDVFAHIAQELRHQYSIGYYPKNSRETSTRKIKIKVDAPGVVISARRAYAYRPATEK
jgi:Ca-activated chloride channel homolog